MKKILKRMITIFIAILILFVILVFVSFINHKIQLSKEDKLFIPTGQMVEVNGHNMHVYTEGDGEETLVFMSGGGTSAPVLDFKSLYSLLSDDYKIVVIEKAGYGFSDITDANRDIDTILSETRQALDKANVEGPYILFPHSMSGIESLYWSQNYPDEIKAIVGLDMAVPSAYEAININMLAINLGAFVSKTGITRLIPSLSDSDAIKYGTLSDEEEKLYKIVFYRRTSTKNMINEVQMIQTNARKIKNIRPKIPMLLFSSNGEGTGWGEETWSEFQKDFISGQENYKLIEYDVSHYIHNIEYEHIAKEAKQFIEEIK